ncbi:MAG: RluA family pseudouridine synthase [Desulfobacteraceae bacterium]|nr:MAG: RluA family pseudouridine synthase [Desulfobacteraceae bacterium]
MKIDFTVPPEYENTRLDHLMAQIIPDCSRSRAASLISSGHLQVDGQTRKPAYKVRAGDTVFGQLPEESPGRVIAEPIHLDILYEDTHVLVINKPAGLVVHPGAGNAQGTLVNALLHHDPGIARAGEDPLRPGIVHRLDKDTSGVMVVARTARAAEFLKKEFKYRRVDKRYLCLVTGVIKADKGEIDLPIGRHPVKRKLMSARSDAPRSALTLWRVKERFVSASLVEARIKTGRTHQIRVHFYTQGYPLIGDPVYQYRKARKNQGGQTKAGRQMLHAFQISFRHPFSGQRMAFEAELPDDFIKISSYLRQLQAAPA